MKSGSILAVKGTTLIRPGSTRITDIVVTFEVWNRVVKDSLEQAMNSLRATEPETQIDLASLLQSLGSDNPMVRSKTRESLVNAGQSAVIPLLRLLKSPTGLVRWEAAKVLGALKVESTANALADLLEDEECDVRWAAAQALVGLGGEGLKQTLMALLTKSGSIWVREGAYHVVSYFANRMSGEYLKPLLKLFGGFEPAVTIPPAALAALYELQRRAKHSRRSESTIKSMS